MLLAVFIEFITVIALILYQTWTLNIVYEDYLRNISNISAISSVNHYESILKWYYNQLPDEDIFENILNIDQSSCSQDNNANWTVIDEIDGCIVSIKEITNAEKSAGVEPFFKGKQYNSVEPSTLFSIVPRTYVTVKKNESNYEFHVMRKKGLKIRIENKIPNNDNYQSIWTFKIQKQ